MSSSYRPDRAFPLLRDHAPWRVPWITGTGGLACLGLSLGLASNPAEVASTYLVACLFFLSLGLGALFFVLVQFVTRAGWSASLRRFAEHVMATIPVLGLLLVPLAGGVGSLYPWARAETSGVALTAWQATYFAQPFFVARAFSYVLVWTVLAWWFRGLSLTQDESRDPEVTRRLQRASAPALILYAVTISFAALDWIMSLESGWSSTIFGVYFFAGCVVGFLALLALAVALPPEGGLINHAVSPEHLHDVGKLLFGFVVFWAYIAFSQYLLIWYASLPEETIFYGRRLGPGWVGLTRLLAAGHFVIPFFFLLAAGVKRKGVTLASAGLWLLAMHYLDLYWLVTPAVRGESAAPSWLHLSTAVGVGLVFLSTLGVLMQRGAAIPIGDPRLAESLAPKHV